MEVTKKKRIIYFSIYLVIFLGLLLVASLFDLQISKILTSGSLKINQYYSDNVIGNIVEIIGSFPIFIALFIATIIMSNDYLKREGKIKYVSILYFICSIVDLTWFFKDTIKYASRIYGFESINDKTWMLAIYIFFAAIVSFVFHYLYYKYNKFDNNKLKKFAYVIFACAIFHLLLEVIKNPVGRMRFRAMNSINDFSYFTNWYQISSAKKDLSSLELIKDSFKSFPSGHTHAAGFSYLLICIPDLFERFNNKKYRIISYIIPVVFTGFVAFYRIRVGAHFMSDVLVGGTLSFTTVSIFRYIFILKNKKSNN